MSGRRLVLADETTSENGEAGYAGGYLWCYVSGMAMDKAARIFCDPKKTAVIRFQYGDLEDAYAGYTQCQNISMDADGQISVCMVKG